MIEHFREAKLESIALLLEVPSRYDGIPGVGFPYTTWNGVNQVGLQTEVFSSTQPNVGTFPWFV